MANLAGLLKEKGRHAEAEVLYRRALESREARHGRGSVAKDDGRGGKVTK